MRLGVGPTLSGQSRRGSSKRHSRKFTSRLRAPSSGPAYSPPPSGTIIPRSFIGTGATMYGKEVFAPTIVPSAVGDFIVVIVFRKNSSAIYTPTATGLTFTTLAIAPYTNLTCMTAFGAFVDNTSPVDIKINGQSSANKTMWAHIAVFSGVDQASPIDVSGVSSATTTYTIPSISTNTDGSVAIAAAMCPDNQALTLTSTEWTQIAFSNMNLTASSPDTSGGSYYLDMPTAGATGDCVLSGGAGLTGVTLSFALKAAT